MASLLLVGMGGFIGSVCRYLVTLSIQKPISGFPLATFGVNLLGSFLIGILLSMDKKFLNSNTSLLLMTGILGGFTTYSAFSGEAMLLFKNQQVYLALIYIFTTVCMGLILTAFGFYLGKIID